MSTHEQERDRMERVQAWQIARQARADAYAAVLTHINAAVAALPEGDAEAERLALELGWNANRARGRLSAILAERNPHVRWEEK